VALWIEGIEVPEQAVLMQGHETVITNEVRRKKWVERSVPIATRAALMVYASLHPSYDRRELRNLAAQFTPRFASSVPP